MKLLKHVMAATLAVAIGSIPAAAQQSNITLARRLVRGAVR